MADDHTGVPHLVERAYAGKTDPAEVGYYGAWRFIASSAIRRSPEDNAYAWRAVQSALNQLEAHGCLKTADRAVGSPEVAPDA